jgi:hypothetical protein
MSLPVGRDPATPLVLKPLVFKSLFLQFQVWSIFCRSTVQNGSLSESHSEAAWRCGLTNL